MTRRLREHSITLSGNRLVLRPMTENDWKLLANWNSDPDILWFSDGDNVQSHSLDETQAIYRSVSQSAFCFIIELEEKAIGECWLQKMNLERYLAEYPGKDSRRIDLTIGEKAFWGKGYGTETIRLLTKFGFEQKHADMIFGCDIADYNIKSLRAFLRNGYRVNRRIDQPAGKKAKFVQDVAFTREDYFAEHPLSP